MIKRNNSSCLANSCWISLYHLTLYINFDMSIVQFESNIFIFIYLYILYLYIHIFKYIYIHIYLNVLMLFRSPHCQCTIIYRSFISSTIIHRTFTCIYFISIKRTVKKSRWKFVKNIYLTPTQRCLTCRIMPISRTPRLSSRRDWRKKTLIALRLLPASCVLCTSHAVKMAALWHKSVGVIVMVSTVSSR